MRAVYLDNNATTPCAPEVVAGMSPCLADDFANPSSPHLLGRQALRRVEAARQQVAQCLKCQPDEIIFTSGATESNNLAILGLFGRMNGTRRRVLTSAIEHKSVLSPCEMLRARGVTVEHVPVDCTGRLRLEELRARLGPAVLLVSVQAANNEVGTIQPVKDIAQLAHEHGAFVHCDAAQALAKIPFDVEELDIDLASFSGHKAYGPKGIGVLVVRAGHVRNALTPLLGGGGQESGLRPGTLNVPCIVGMGIACELATTRMTPDASHLSKLRDMIEDKLVRCIREASVNGNRTMRLPGTTNIVVPGIPADVIIANAPGVCISSGSACTSGTVAPSHVLTAMGLSGEDAECAIRISVGRSTTQEDAHAAVEHLVTAIRDLQSRGARATHERLSQ